MRRPEIDNPGDGSSLGLTRGSRRSPSITTKTPPPLQEKWGFFSCLSHGTLFYRGIGLLIVIDSTYTGEHFLVKNDFTQFSSVLIPANIGYHAHQVIGNCIVSLPNFELARRSAKLDCYVCFELGHSQEVWKVLSESASCIQPSTFCFKDRYRLFASCTESCSSSAASSISLANP